MFEIPYSRACLKYHIRQHTVDLFTHQELSVTLSQTALLKNAFENIVGIGENVGTQHFLLFTQFLFPIRERNRHLRNIKLVVSKCFQFGPV